MTYPTDEERQWAAMRPGERIWLFTLDRLASLNARAKMECREPTCGERGEDNEVVSCSSKNCGKKLMLSGWRRELQVMEDIAALVEALERKKLQDDAAEDKRTRGKRS